MSRKSAIVGGLLLVAVSAAPVFANHVRDVLDDQTAAGSVNFPPVASGPGYFLPDSPLYVIDKAFQSFRLVFAFTPERRVAMHNLILGERLAELRVMVERGNREAIQSTLNEIAYESEKISSDLADAAAQGKDVGTLAKNTNDLMKLYREILKTVALQADSSLALQIESTRQTMLVAKIRVEDQLTEEEMLEAMENDLEDEVDTQVLAAETHVIKLEQRLNRLNTVTGSTDDQTTTDLTVTTIPKPTPTLEELRKKKQEVMDKRKKLIEELKARKKKAKEERKRKMLEVRQKARELRKKLQELRKAIRAEKNGGDLSGFTVADCGTEKDWKNHGEYVSCVAKLKQKGKTSEAAKSDIGKKNAAKTPTSTVTLVPTIVVE
ncbi:MAG: hypothetical protein HY431_02860 [Candidatus Levybacteria bacterium]|nr:hypothetical protein [Candidatus Levybacteria bacterium]